MRLTGQGTMLIVSYVNNFVIQWATRHLVDDFRLRPATSGVTENVFQNSPCVGCAITPACLFNRDRLREIARLVDVVAARERRVVREKLQRHDVQNRR